MYVYIYIHIHTYTCMLREVSSAPHSYIHLRSDCMQLQVDELVSIKKALMPTRLGSGFEGFGRSLWGRDRLRPRSRSFAGS